MMTRTVYSLYYPETREIVERLWSEKHHEWYERAYDKHQDAMHVEFLETWRAWSGVDLGDAFPHAYPTSGASEPIKDLLLPPGAVHVFAGDYEGYGIIAHERGMQVVTHDRNMEAARATFGEHDQFWISQPSAIDGCVWPELDAFLEELGARAPHVRVHLDVTYVGATKTPVTLSPRRHANVAAVVFSLSKPMGVYYHRIGGCLSRTPMGTLVGNLWFKNLFSLKLGTALMKAHGVTSLPAKYAPLQSHVLERLRADGRVPADARASDVVLLAHAPHGPDESEEFMRAKGHHRFCLTEGMAKKIESDMIKGETNA